MPVAEFPSLRIEQDFIDISQPFEPDPEWNYVDTAGHFHSWDMCGEKPKLPTLRYVEDIPGTGEYPPYGHYECIRCGAEVAPVHRPVSIQQYREGMKRCYINGREATIGEFRRMIDSIQRFCAAFKREEHEKKEA